MAGTVTLKVASIETLCRHVFAVANLGVDLNNGPSSDAYRDGHVFQQNKAVGVEALPRILRVFLVQAGVLEPGK